MGTTTTQSIVVAPIEPFFCDSFERCVRPGSLLPFQVMGLVPCTVADEEECRQPPCTTLPVFADDTGNQKQNDFSYFLFDFPTASGNDYILQEYTGGSWVNVVTLDNSTGTIFDFGAFPDYPKRSGVCIDWSAILITYGEGVYRLFLEASNAPDPKPSLVSLPFRLLTFDCELVTNTVRVETNFAGRVANLFWKEGSTIPKDFDLVQMEWDDQCRYYGNCFVQRSQKEEYEYTRSTNRRRINRQKIQRKYNLSIEGTIAELLLRFDIYAGAARDVRVSNYNKENALHLNREQVIVLETFEFEYYNSAGIPISSVQLESRFKLEYQQC